MHFYGIIGEPLDHAPDAILTPNQSRDVSAQLMWSYTIKLYD